MPNTNSPNWAVAQDAARGVADVVIRTLPAEAQLAHIQSGFSYYCVNPAAYEELATVCQMFIAEIIGSVINAGSERDAVNEDQSLHAALVAAFAEWGPEPSHFPATGA